MPGRVRWTERTVRALGGPERTRVVVVLGAVLAMDGADKGAVSAVAGGLKESFGLTNTGIGLLVSVVALAAAVFTVPAGLLTDRVRRTRLLAASAALWVAATVVSALATSFLWLLVARAGLGAVTATAGPAVASLSGDYFPARERARMLGYILVGELAGTGLGFAVSSVAGDLLGWRLGIWWLAVPGLLVVWAVARLPEPERGGQSMLRPEPGASAGAGDGEGLATQAARARGITPDPRLVLRSDPRRRSRWWALGYVLRVPTNMVLIIASALGYFYFTGVRAFANIFAAEQYGLRPSLAGALVLLAGVGAIAGVLTGGRVADRMLRRGRVNARVLVAVVALLAIPPVAAPALATTALLLALPLLTLAGALLGAVNPPMDAARLDIMHPYLWGTAEGARTFLRTLGDAAAPTVIGYVSTSVFTGDDALLHTLLLFLVALVAAAGLGLIALRTYPRDVATALASARELGTGGESGGGKDGGGRG
ncbi:MFS transporter [Streptomyces sp. JJ36]|uniref:MFS transporter n=1 Tax=Streptomyces sp. JJ36 TaxID=2736645 RepID=UPI001F0119F6|nr:MFS transporter [Streptomyces sp. JJ36]MCF6525225.1 MFS transporter [Streptomyces sp. JJ36]